MRWRNRVREVLMAQSPHIGRSTLQVNNLDRVAIEVLTPQYTHVGKSVLRVDAQEKVTGETVYSGDINIPRMLFGKCKRSPHPFARILSVDISKALKLSGVKAAVTAKNVRQFPFGEFFADQLPLCAQMVSLPPIHSARQSRGCI